MKTKTTILLITLLILSMITGYATTSPVSAQSSDHKNKLRLIERGQYWERYYNPEKGTYVLRIYADAQYLKNPYTGEWVPYLWEYCRAFEPCLYRVWIPHASFDVNRNGTLTVYDVNRTQVIFLERFLIHYRRETRFGLKTLVYETFRDFRHEIEEHGDETLIKLTYTYPSGTLTVEISLHKGAHYAKTLHYKPLNPNLRYSIVLERRLPEKDLKLKIRDKLLSLKGILSEETLPGNLTSIDLRHGKRLLARDVFPEPELLKDVRLFFGRIRYRFGEFREEVMFRDPTTTISPPTDDAYVDSDYPDTNYGSETRLRLSSTRRIYIKFNITSLYDLGSPIYCELRIRRYEATNDVNEYEVRRVVSDWSEDQITWNNQPSTTDQNVVYSPENLDNGWLEINVTAQVQDAFEEESSYYSVMMRVSSGDYGYYRSFYSKEYDGYDPELYVEYRAIITINLTLVNKTLGGLEANDYFQANYTYLGKLKTAQLVNGTNTLTIDNETTITVCQISYLSNSTYRSLLNETYSETFYDNATRLIYYWKQYYVTVSVTKADPDFTSTDSSNYFTATGTVNGSTQVSFSPLYEGNSISKWLDAGSTLTIDSTSTGSNENEVWDIVDTSWTVTDTSHTFYYWDHLKITLQPQISKPYSQSLTSSNYATVTYTSYGSNFTANVWINDTNPSIWVDRGGNVYWSTTTSASTTLHRWATPGAVTLEGIGSAASSSATYYEQYKVTWHLTKAHANFSATTASNYFNATGQQFNGSLTLTGLYLGHDVSDWVDYQSTITISSLSSASTSTHKWISGGESYTVTSGGTYQFTYIEYVKGVYVGYRILDADEDDYIQEGVSYVKIQNLWNSTVIQAEPDTALGWLHYNITHRIYRIKWRGIWIDLRTNQTLTPTSPNYKYNFTVPDVWLLGDSEIEWYLKSSSGSEVYTWVWGENTETLVVIQGKNRGDEIYFYYGGYGKSPQYVYVDGGLVENYALEEDPDLQVLHIPFPAERVDLDFSGASREAESEVSQLSGMVNQILNQLSLIRAAFVNITQPSGPTIRVPTIDIRSWLSGVAAWIIAWIDTYSPIKTPLLIPLLIFTASFITLYSIARKLGLKRPQHPPPSAGETIVVVKRERGNITSVLAKSAATSLIAALITYLVLPRLFPAHFAQPSSFQLTIVAMVLASIIVSLAAWMAHGRSERLRGEKQ